MYKPNTIIVGASGTGKSTCYENLPDTETAVIDTEQKGFPFLKEFSNVFVPTNAGEYYTEMAKIKTYSQFKYVVNDSLSKHFENCMSLCRASYKGYDIYTYYNIHVRKTLQEMKSMDKYMIGICIDEFVEILSPEGTKTSARRAAVLGKEWEGKIEKEFLIALFTDVRKDKNGKMDYRFMTNVDGICAAKTPAWMYPNQQFIPNDLMAVFDKIEQAKTKISPTNGKT